MNSRSHPTRDAAQPSPSASGSNNDAVVEHGAAVRPMYGQCVSGDAAFTVDVEGYVLAIIVDVLGHGEEAHDLAARIQDYLLSDARADVVKLMSELHEKFRGSRGAAVALCLVETATGRVRFAGIGNTVTRCFGESETHLISREGVVGGAMRTPIEQTARLADGDVILMHTDGVMSHFKLAEYPRLRTDTPQEAAHTIIQRFGKLHDDASCLVLRYRQ